MIVDKTIKYKLGQIYSDMMVINMNTFKY